MKSKPSEGARRAAKAVIQKCVPDRFWNDALQDSLARIIDEEMGDCVNVKELIEAARNAALQIEYLHGKFQETSSGNQVLAQLNHRIKEVENALRGRG